MASTPNSSELAVLPAPAAADVLYIVDISGYVFRAFYALPPLTGPTGEPTGALYGVTSMLLKLVREQQPHLLAVAMDGRGPSFRKQQYAAYKANRPSAPDDLKFQMAKIKEVAEVYAIPCYEYDDAEADDVIASLVRKARARGLRVVIVSADKDLLQLVGDGVCMLDTMKQRAFGPDETLAKLGVTPAQVQDYLALTGDSSDNVPGVPSVGPKTAASLLNEYGSLDGIYAHLSEIKKKALKQKLEEHREAAYLSRELVALKDDLALELDQDKLRYGGFDQEALRRFFKTYGFVRLLEQLEPQAASAAPRPPPQAAALAIRPLRIITDEAGLNQLASALRGAKALDVCCAVEGNEPVAGDFIGIALAWGRAEGEAAYLPFGHRYLGCPAQLPQTQVLAALTAVLQDERVAKRSSNSKRDAIALGRCGVILAGVAFDSMLASYLLDPDLRGHDVHEIVLRRHNQEILGYDELVGRGKARRPLGELSFEEVASWLGPHVSLLEALTESLGEELAQAQLSSVLFDIELPLSCVLAEMEQRGVRCDPDKLRALSRSVDKQLAELEKKCFQLAEREFNVASPRQLETILFDELGLPVIERTKTARSTNHDVLEELAILHPLPATILEHRSLAKLKGTYLDALPRQINPHTGRIHTKFEQAVAATGRLSSNDPNLQNIPIRTEVGREIREAFVAEPGFRIFAADYSQIELRVLAHLSGDDALASAFADGADVHALTAQALFGAPPDQITREMRAAAKTVNFAVIYGQTQFALARNLRIPRAEAARYIKAFFARYAGVRRYLDGLVEEARASGCVRTLLGRRRFVRDIQAKNRNVRAGAERIAQNMPIQGSAADIMKLAMVRVQAALKRAKLRSHMVLTVHDELVFEAAPDEAGVLEPLVREAMEGAVSLRVPLVVEMGWGDNWGEAH